MDKEKREEFFEKIYLEYENRIYKYILHKIGNSEDAHDLKQEVFVVAYTRIEQLYNQPVKLAWIYKVASNKILKYWKKHNTKENISLSDELINELITDELFNEEPFEDYKSIIQQEDIDLLIYKYHFEYKNVEIANIMKISVNNVGIKLKRIRDKIKKFYESM